MTQQEIIDFIIKNNIPGPITWGEYKRLLILENLLLSKVTNIPTDVETLSIYTKLTEKDLESSLKKLIDDYTKRLERLDGLEK